MTSRAGNIVVPTRGKPTIRAKMPIQWQKIFTPQIIIASVLLIFCTIMIVVCLLNPGTKEVSVTSAVENMAPLDAITPKDRVVQKFTADDDCAKFGLYYANFSDYIQGGNLHIDVTNSQEETTTFTYDIGGTFDNSFLYLDYPLKKGETYVVNIYVSDGARGVTFFTTMADNYDAKLTINGHVEDFSIIMTFNNYVEDIFAAWYYVLFATLIMCYLVLKIDRSVYGRKA